MRSLLFALTISWSSVVLLAVEPITERHEKLVGNSASPLTAQIDELILKSAGIAVAPSADEATWLRRIYLDFAGRIPTVLEARAFLANKQIDRRAQLVDQLLASPEYARRMRELFHVMLLERRGDNEEWSRYLEQSFAANKPWDQLVREILAPQADDETLRGAAFFHTKRLEKVGQQETDHAGLTRDIGRLFMGVDLQCAQCHDHLTIDEYKQLDFQGLYSVVSRSFIRTDKKFPAVGEKAIPAKLEFTSVFEGVKRETGPRVPFGQELPLLPVPAKGQPPASSLALIAAALPTPENPRFTRNIVNRLWFVMLGRGLIHPLDLQHAQNPPACPELFELLTREFSHQRFDVKWLLREIALSETYARSSRYHDQQIPAPELFAVAQERRLSAEQILWSLLAATLDPIVWQDEQQRTALFAKHRPKLLAAFANPPKDPELDYQASLQGALFTLHDSTLPALLEPQGQNLMARVLAHGEVNAAMDELYQALLVRLPTEDERRVCQKLLADYGTQRRVEAWRDIAWAMIAGLEFSLNH